MGVVISVASVGLAAPIPTGRPVRRVHVADEMVGDAPIAVGRVDGVANPCVVSRLSLRDEFLLAAIHRIGDLGE